MKWFGVSWHAPMCEQCDHVPPPVGEKCVHCDECIVARDSGVIYANGPVAHRNCFLRGVHGSLAHLLHHCSCYVPGSECADDPKLTMREAADEVARFLGYTDDDLMCDFCAARGPLPGTVHGKKRVAGTFESGSLLLDDGEWGACGECEELIRACNWHGLLERAIAGTCALYPDLAFDFQQRQRMTEMIEGVFGVKL
jgi:hypothetical protein